MEHSKLSACSIGILGVLFLSSEGTVTHLFPWRSHQTHDSRISWVTLKAKASPSDPNTQEKYADFCLTACGDPSVTAKNDSKAAGLTSVCNPYLQETGKTLVFKAENLDASKNLCLNQKLQREKQRIPKHACHSCFDPFSHFCLRDFGWKGSFNVFFFGGGCSFVSFIWCFFSFLFVLTPEWCRMQSYLHAPVSFLAVRTGHPLQKKNHVTPQTERRADGWSRGQRSLTWRPWGPGSPGAPLFPTIPWKEQKEEFRSLKKVFFFKNIIINKKFRF